MTATNKDIIDSVLNILKEDGPQDKLSIVNKIKNKSEYTGFSNNYIREIIDNMERITGNIERYQKDGTQLFKMKGEIIEEGEDQ